MRQPHTFLLTVLLDDDDPSRFCGRVRLVATGQEVTFTQAEELLQFLRVPATWSPGTDPEWAREDPKGETEG